jgi:hypothetical protein
MLQFIAFAGSNGGMTGGRTVCADAEMLNLGTNSKVISKLIEASK